MEEIIQAFLEVEVSGQALYDDIMDFILSPNIRCGEYECNRFVIKKMDPLNYIIYEEYASHKKGKRKIFNSFALNKDLLIQLMNEYAMMQGLKTKEI